MADALKNAPETNVEFLERNCEFAPEAGAMAQCFAIEAIRKFSEAIVEMGIEDLTKEMGERSFISPELWMACAKHWKDALDNRKS